MLQLAPFLARFNLKRVDVPDDGHCFVSCIRLFFREYLPHVPDQTIAMLRDKFHRLNLREAFSLQGAISDEQFDQHSHEFFDQALFNNQFFDLFIGFRDQLFNVKIIIIKVMEGEQTVMVDTSNMTYGHEHNHYPDHTILLLRDRRAHYQLLVPANRQIFSTISRFNRNTGVGGDITVLGDKANEPAAATWSTQQVVDKPPHARATPKAKQKKRRTRKPITETGRIRKEKAARKRRNDNLTPAEKIVRARRDRLNKAAHRRREKEGMPEYCIAFVYEDIDEEHELYAEHDLGPMDIPCTSCGALHWEAERTGKSTNFTMCCEKGKVSLPPLRAPPADLLAMFADQNDPMHKEMIDNAIKYNTAFATASAVADTVVFRGNGPPVYKIHGVIIRRMSCLETAEGKRPSHGQYFMLDADIALNERINNPVNHDCDPEVSISRILFNQIDLIRATSYFQHVVFRCLRVSRESSVCKRTARKSTRSWPSTRECMRSTRSKGRPLRHEARPTSRS